MKGVYIFLADGFEETEAITTIDMLRRGGVPVVSVAVNECEEDDGDIYCRVVTSSHGLPVVADVSLLQFLQEQDASSDEETTSQDVMIFPGGMPGSNNLASCTPLMDLMVKHRAYGGTLAAICAAPAVVLGRLDDLDGVKMTCYKGFEDTLERRGAVHVDAPVSVDDRIITACSAGHTIGFGLAVLSFITEPARSEYVSESIML